MREITITYEGSEAPGGGRQADRELPAGALALITLVSFLALGIMLAYVFKKLAARLLPGDIGEDADDFLTGEFSSQLGIKDGAIAGIPLKYKWLPRLPSRFRRPGHPASLDLEFTVNNPHGARLRVHKEGAFNKPLGFLPPEVQAPPLIEAQGFVLRLEPGEALPREAAKVLDEAVAPLCAAGLYEAILEGNKLSVSVIRTATYEIEETKVLVEAAAQAAQLFN